MISEKDVLKTILESLQSVKDSESVYSDWQINESSVVLGAEGRMDSVAFTSFVISLEEKIESALGQPFTLDLQKIYGTDDPELFKITASELAKRIFSHQPQ